MVIFVTFPVCFKTDMESKSPLTIGCTVRIILAVLIGLSPVSSRTAGSEAEAKSEIYRGDKVRFC